MHQRCHPRRTEPQNSAIAGWLFKVREINLDATNEPEQEKKMSNSREASISLT